jgi:hypothetical protein
MADAGDRDLRVSDQQRERAVQDIREHFAAGRLTEDELSDRVQAAYSAQTERELMAQLADLPKLPATPAEQKAEIVARRRHLQRRLVQEAGGGMGGFLICTAIWAASGASGFFWPIFVALGVVIPLLRSGWRLYGPAPELDRIERELESRGHRDARSQRRAARSDRRRDR